MSNHTQQVLQESHKSFSACSIASLLNRSSTILRILWSPLRRKAMIKDRTALTNNGQDSGIVSLQEVRCVVAKATFKKVCQVISLLSPTYQSIVSLVNASRDMTSQRCRKCVARHVAATTQRRRDIAAMSQMRRATCRSDHAATSQLINN